MTKFLPQKKFFSLQFRLIIFCTFIISFIFIVSTYFLTKNSDQILIHSTEKNLSKIGKQLFETYKKNNTQGVIEYLSNKEILPDNFLYAILDQTGKVISSNISYIDKKLFHKFGEITTPFQYKSKLHDKVNYAIGYHFHKYGLHIYIGENIESEEHNLFLFEKIITFSILSFLLAFFISWLIIGRIAVFRINRLFKIMQELGSGNFSKRLPISSYNDNIDFLAKHLNEMLEKVENLTSNLKHVSDNIAHDLKTPLTRLCNHIQNALLQEGNKESYQLLIESTLKECLSLIKIFDSILLVSRLEYNKDQFFVENCNLEEILTEIFEFYQCDVENQKVKYRLKNTFHHIQSIHRELVCQNLFNIIQNSNKYALQEGKTLEICLSMERDEKYTYLIVEDNGKGVPEEDFHKITERFVRLDKSRTTSGFGIGLSLVSAVMKAHNGVLVFENAQPGLRVKLGFLNH